METKTFKAALEFKDDGGEPGEFRAIFSRFNVIDADGDVTLEGAFTQGEKVRVSYWAHRWQDLPVGRGVVHYDKEVAWIDGKFFLDTIGGEQTYRTVKALSDLGQWSYGFDVEEWDRGTFEGQDVRFLRKLRIYEVSPVLVGAGRNTHTVDIKSEHKRAIGPHSTATDDAAWDGPANEARLRTDGSASYYRRAFAYQDLEADPETKAAYKFIHHFVDGSGNIGAARTRACSAGIAVLNGGRGGTTIPAADRQGVYNHLARHLRDADMEPPELRSARSRADLLTDVDVLEIDLIRLGIK